MSFRRQKGVPKGGPDGGNGGRGGDVFLVGRHAVRALKAFQVKKLFSAETGENGRGKDQYGKNGAHLEVEVPCGTVVHRVQNAGTGETLVGEVVEEGQRLRVARGGAGGRGNAMFASSRQQAPFIAEKGQAGQGVRLRLELRLIADVGIVGKPNAGKSSLLAAVSAARPKIAPYPFTTTEPQLGVVGVGWRTFVLAEIPGLIEGAHLGIGLGQEFLRHAMRTRVLIHLVDGSGEDVFENIAAVNEELAAFGMGLEDKTQIIAVNKADMPEVRAKEGGLGRRFARKGLTVHFVSAATGEGVSELMLAAAKQLEQEPAGPPVASDDEGEAVVPVVAGRRKPPGAVSKDTGVYVVHDERAIRLIGGSDLRVWAARAQLRGRLDRMGVTAALEESGIQPGDTVRFGDIELIW